MNSDWLDSLNLEGLLKLAKGEISSDQLEGVFHSAQNTKIGTVSFNQSHKNILNSRKVFVPNSLYGTILGKDITFMVDMSDPSCKSSISKTDIYSTDRNGIIKNSIHSLSAAERIANAKKNGENVVMLLGGSTIMGTGSLLPNLSIPSLVEKFLHEKYSIKATVINYGVAGYTSNEAFELLVNNCVYQNPDAVIFYDGWNCLFHFLIQNYFEKNNLLPIAMPGMGVRQIENDYALMSIYDPRFQINRSIKLLLNYFFSTLQAALSNEYLSDTMNNFINKYLVMNKSTSLQHLPEIVSDINVRKNVSVAADRYHKNHEMANQILDFYNIKFFHYLQPIISWGHKPLTADEILFEKSFMQEQMKEVYVNFKESILSKKKDWNFIDLTSCFDECNEDVYVDSGHINGLGNYFIAELIANDLAQNL